jgi:hypothetical protein
MGTASTMLHLWVIYKKVINNYHGGFITRERKAISRQIFKTTVTFGLNCCLRNPLRLDVSVACTRGTQRLTGDTDSDSVSDKCEDCSEQLRKIVTFVIRRALLEAVKSTLMALL